MNTYECNYILDLEIKKKLLSQAQNQTKFRKYLTDNGTITELDVASNWENSGIISTNEVNYIQSLINNKFKINAVVFLKFLPNAFIFPHVDDSLSRTSCITWALSPEIENFSPVKYYNSYNENDLNEIKYYSEKPLILNTRNIHSMKNNNFERISVQLCLSNTIEELALADLKNELFIK